jgi:hypothetical protein
MCRPLLPWPTTSPPPPFPFPRLQLINQTSFVDLGLTGTPRLQSFTFQLPEAFPPAAPLRAFVYEWDDALPGVTGPALYAGAQTSAAAGALTTTLSPPAAVDPSKTYVMFLSSYGLTSVSCPNDPAFAYPDLPSSWSLSVTIEGQNGGLPANGLVYASVDPLTQPWDFRTDPFDPASDPSNYVGATLEAVFLTF